MEKTDLNRRLHLALGRCWHEQVSTKKNGYGCACGFLTYFGGQYGEHEKNCPNPDYCADPRLVIEAMREKLSEQEFEDFVNIGIQHGNWYDADEWIDLFMNREGKLAKLALEFLTNKKGE